MGKWVGLQLPQVLGSGGTVGKRPYKTTPATNTRIWTLDCSCLDGCDFSPSPWISVFWTQYHHPRTLITRFDSLSSWFIPRLATMGDDILKAETGVVEQIETRQGLSQAPPWIRDLDAQELEAREKKLIRKIDLRL